MKVFLDIRKFIFTLLVSGSYLFSVSQVAGKVVLCDDTEPVTFLSIDCILAGGDTVQLVTDEKGDFNLNQKAKGDVYLSIRSPYYADFDTIIKVDFSSRSYVVICLLPTTPVVNSEELIISGSSGQGGELTFSRNQYKVMPASFQDPSRILLRNPGFTTSGDGANGIVFRGLAPEMHKWQLFGADIVNPNHLSNAGTANDLATSNAGGVNAINGSVMGQYHFEPNPAKACYSDVGSGISNVSLADSMRTYSDINLIGIEGGIGTSFGNKNVYAAYRYSFVGILEKLGVQFGNEKIGYQDFSFYGDILKSQKQKLRGFTVLGESVNNHFAKSISDTLTSFKDMQNIFFKNRVGMFGADYARYIGSFGKLTSTLVYSGRETSRNENSDLAWAALTDISLSQSHVLKESILSSHTRYEAYLNARMPFSVGLRTKINWQSWESLHIPFARAQFWQLYPYLEFQKKFNFPLPMLVFAGFGGRIGNYLFNLEPYLGIQSAISSVSSLHIRFRSASTSDYTDPLFVSALKYNQIRGYHGQFTYKYAMPGYQAGTQLFMHYFHNMPAYSIDGQTNGIFSIFNGGSGGYDFIFSPAGLTPSGTSPAASYGCEVFGKVNLKNWQIDANLSILDASFKGNIGEKDWQPSRYSVGHISNLTILYQKDKKSGENTSLVMAGVAIHYRGGFRRQNFQEVTSSNVVGVYDPGSLHSHSFAPYFRTDLRIVYKKQKGSKGLIHRWSLDVQNLFNRENEGYYSYDPYLKRLLLQKQLGLVPVTLQKLRKGG